jgi:hypothetical protein
VRRLPPRGQRGLHRHLPRPRHPPGLLPRRPVRRLPQRPPGLPLHRPALGATRTPRSARRSSSSGPTPGPTAPTRVWPSSARGPS